MMTEGKHGRGGLEQQLRAHISIQKQEEANTMGMVKTLNQPSLTHLLQQEHTS